MKWLDCTNMPPEPPAGSRMMSWSLDDVHDGLRDRWRREELAAIMRALLRKLGEEVLVDPAEHVTGGAAQALGVEHARHFFENVPLEGP